MQSPKNMPNYDWDPTWSRHQPLLASRIQAEIGTIAPLIPSLLAKTGALTLDLYATGLRVAQLRADLELRSGSGTE